MNASAIINKSFRANVLPVLKRSGFQTVDPRIGWLWSKDTIWVFEIRAVGNYFSHSTKWPPSSVCVWLGIYLKFAPEFKLKKDKFDRELPKEYMCQICSQLERSMDLPCVEKGLLSPMEAERKDIWWIDQEGETAEEVAKDIANALLEHGIPWYRRMSDMEYTLSKVEVSRDCFSKFTKAALIAHHIGDIEKWKYYDELAEKEAIRIGFSTDRSTWSGQ